MRADTWACVLLLVVLVVNVAMAQTPPTPPSPPPLPPPLPAASTATPATPPPTAPSVPPAPPLGPVVVSPDALVPKTPIGFPRPSSVLLYSIAPFSDIFVPPLPPVLPGEASIATGVFPSILLSAVAMICVLA